MMVPLKNLEHRLSVLVSHASTTVWQYYGSTEAILLAFVASLDRHRGMDVEACLDNWLKTEKPND